MSDKQPEFAQLQLFNCDLTLQQKQERAIQIITLASEMSKKYYNLPLIITYSGGKDSDVLVDLALKSKAYVEFQNNHTTVDAPETVYHIRDTFNRLQSLGYKTTINYPKNKNGERVSMWSLIVKKRMPPTRLVRYCCEVLKETGGTHRIIATGIRGEESAKRKKRSEFEIFTRKQEDRKGVPLEKMQSEFSANNEDDIYDCLLIQHAKKNKKIVVNPIFGWTEKDVWDYIREQDIKYNVLYDRGWKRVGCIGCPLSGYKQQAEEFKQYPIFKQNYIAAFQRMVDKRKADGLETKWNTGQEVFNWWIGNKNDND